MNWRKPVLESLYFISQNPTPGHMKYLEAVDTKSAEQIRELQNEKLAQLLLHAYENIPYYESIFSSAGLSKNKNSLVENFESIPILTKEIIQEQGEKLYSKDYKDRGWYKNSTGGSTGEPVTFIQDKQYKAWGLASQYHKEKKLGKDLGQPGLKLWGSERDISRSKDKFAPRVIQWLQNQVVLNCFRMTDENLKIYIHEWNRQKPRLVTGYASALFEFARQVQNLKSELHRPDAIISAAETLSENTRQYVEEIFQCPVVNLYGSREAGLIACECLKKEGLHIASLHTKVEILTDDLRPSSPGQIGNIYITTLDNYSMPLIRYRIGDTAVPTDKTCSCGNPHPLIEKITGRQMEVFKTRKGTVVPGEFFIHYIGVVCNKGYVKKFQVIQKDYEHIIVKAVVIDVKQFNDSKEHLVSLIRKVMGTSCNVEFMLVEDIPLTKSGKFQYTISEI